jgi:hypothetical protein
MSRKEDWLPGNHEALYDKAKQTVSYLNTGGNRERFGLGGGTPPGVWYDTTFTPKYNAYTGAFETWQNPATRTTVVFANLNTAQGDFTPAYRQLYTGFLRNNPLVTDGDLIAMGLPQHSSGGHTPAPVPTTTPGVRIKLPAPGIVELDFFDATSEKRAKPDGVHGTEIAWAILDTTPTDWSQLVHSAFDTHTPYRFSFSGEDRGKKLFFALRWENNRGEKGPWSEIFDAIIP